ncbi:MAG: type II toxin-antitoxin system RelE/ParE family toxin [Verrucomicrobiales bacterium]|nr:type II toxin-antitoxin system RelE/ParE family toxin [Verrucomicrobiales bacterium]
MKPALIHSQARAELDAAISFYESRAAGLGLDLQAKVEDGVRAIQRSPESWPPHKQTGFRKYFVERFPYTLYYLEMPDCIWIAAVAHGSRRPGYWMGRQLE